MTSAATLRRTRLRRAMGAIAAISIIVTHRPGHAAPESVKEMLKRCNSTTEALSERQRYVEAATESHRCWDQTQKPLFLVREAEYWRKADCHAHALRAYEEYLQHAERDDPRSSRPKIAKGGVTDELGNTAEVSLRFEPALRSEEEVVLTLVRGEDGPPLSVIAVEEPTTARLDPGDWTVTYKRDEFPDATAMISVADVRDTPEVVLTTSVSTEPRDKPPAPSPGSPKPTNGLLIGGAIVAAGGIAMFGVAGWARGKAAGHRDDYNQVMCDSNGGEKCQGWYESISALKRPWTAGVVTGSILLGTGAAMLIVSILQRKGKLAGATQGRVSARGGALLVTF